MDGQGVTPTPALEARQIEAASLLGRLADDLDISPTQYERAKKAYESIGELVELDLHPMLASASVFPQGSFALGTIIQPIDRRDGEFDVDLACRLDANTELVSPTEAKRILGQCLRKDGHYREKLEEKSRCWRINYAGSFHLDICPLVRGPASDAVPDKELASWILTSPEKYAAWFNGLADRVRPLRRSNIALEAQVDPFPESNSDKGWLRRVVQLLKRHRDQWRMRASPEMKEFAPISIILTTLAARVVEQNPSLASSTSSPYAVVNQVLTGLKDGIKGPLECGEWLIQSPVANENFANRWNQDQRWARAFDLWHRDALRTLHSLVSAHGLDSGKRVLAEGFGEGVADKVVEEYGTALREARDRGQLKYSEGGLIVAAAHASPGVSVPRHTFFGE
nr:nucleotidyltransferase [Frateuria flava]